MTEQILAVQKMQDNIEVHLSEVITLAALAEYIRRCDWLSPPFF